MTKDLDLMEEFRRLLRKCGPAAEPFVNIERFWEQKDYLADRRHHLEKYIQQAYLPGFTFESDAHFLWHFNARDDPFLILRGRMPDRYFEHWLRAIMVPSTLHYRAEIALALKKWDARYRPRLERSNRWNSSWSWPNRVLQVLEMAPVVGFESRGRAVDVHSIYRWERNAETMRESRLRGHTPSRWCIECIALPGDHEAGLGSDYDHIITCAPPSDHPYYRETWHWAPHPDHPAPDCDSISFATPAPSALWQKPWKNKKRRVPSGR